jgi:hypothetical protein
MALITKPVNLSLTWASGGDVLNPGDTKYATGWQVEIPPRQWFNYLDNRQDTALAHINQHGVVVWDATTEYQAGKSYVQGLTTGTVYRSKQTHTNQDPELDVGEVYWEFAFASPGDFYTKVQTDALYLAKASNLGDLPNTATARTNLSVYSQAQTYTKTEVDAKTAVSSTAQAQAWASNTTLITPLRLAEAFKAGNQSLATNGYQKMPGGLIVQWGYLSAGTDGQAVVFPIQFPNACFGIQITDSAGNAPHGATTLTVSGFTLRTTAPDGIAARWLAYGF